MSDYRQDRPWHTSQNNVHAANGTSATAQNNDDVDVDAVGFTIMDFVKVLLFIFNVVFVLVGITLAGIGIWTAVDKIYVSAIIGNDLFTSASYLMIVGGIITIGICILGIVCIFKKNLRWTMVYFGLLIFASVMLLVTAIIVVVFQAEVEDAMVGQMRDTLINGYGSDREVTEAWDQVQSDLKCCAISQTVIGGESAYLAPYPDGTTAVSETERLAQDSWPIYKRTKFYTDQQNLAENDKKYVPPSCCIYEDKAGSYRDLGFCQNFVSGPPTNYITDLENSYLQYEGCYQKAKSLVMDQAVILIGLGFAFAFLMIAGIFLTFLFMRHLSNEEKSESRRRKQPDNL